MTSIQCLILQSNAERVLSYLLLYKLYFNLTNNVVFNPL